MIEEALFHFCAVGAVGLQDFFRLFFYFPTFLLLLLEKPHSFRARTLRKMGTRWSTHGLRTKLRLGLFRALVCDTTHSFLLLLVSRQLEFPTRQPRDY